MRRVVALAVFSTLACLAHGQSSAPSRPLPIPDAAKAAVIKHVEGMNITLDGQAQSLSPGAQIRDQANLIIVPMQIPPGVQVRYLLDNAGLVSRVWILTDDEKAALPVAPLPQPASTQQ